MTIPMIGSRSMWTNEQRRLLVDQILAFKPTSKSGKRYAGHRMGLVAFSSKTNRDGQMVT